MSAAVILMAIGISAPSLAKTQKADAASVRIIDTETVFNVNTQSATDWRPAGSDIDRVVSFFDQFANLRLRTADGDAGYSSLSLGLQQQSGRDEWRSSSMDFIRDNGPLSALQVLRDQLVSEDDPYADGSVPVAVDFAARSTAGNFICGFAIITADDGADAEAGQFKVHRMEQTGIDRTLLTPMASPYPIFSGRYPAIWDRIWRPPSARKA